jgi:hypothetical protein
VPAKGATSVAGQVAEMPTLTKATKKRPVTVRRTVLKSCSSITRVGVSSSLALLLAPIHPNFVETEFYEVQQLIGRVFRKSSLSCLLRLGVYF